MLGTLHQTADAGDYIRLGMQESLYQTVDAREIISDSGCRRLYIRQQMQEPLYQTADARDYIRQDARYHVSGMQESLYQTADARNYIRQRMQETL